jgi:hypothetical protein
MIEAIKELNRLYEVLERDTHICQDKFEKMSTDELKGEESEFWRRAFVRASFSLVEGVTYGLKQVALKSQESGGVVYSDEELSMLKEKSYDLNDKGDAYSQTKYIHITRNIKFAFKAFARAFGEEYELKVDDSGWNYFKEALEIRNRLTHPKTSADLDVSLKELRKMLLANAWFIDSYLALNSIILGYVEKEIDGLDKELGGHA